MRKILSLTLALSLGLSLAIAGGCKQEDDRQGAAGEAGGARGGTVELVYVDWSSEIASTHVAKEVLERMGYDVKLTSVSAAAMWTAVGTGDVDGMVAAWLPTIHADYLDKVRDDVEDLGPNLEGTRSGLVVPEYVTIDSITEMSEHAEKFDNRIVGIEPGAGIMSATEQVLEQYNLEDIELVSSSGAAMTAELGNAIKNNEWIAVTGWTPHWKFARWDLKYLEDPEGVYGGEEEIHTIVRKGLEQDMPQVYAFLDNFEWTPAMMQEVMVCNRQEGHSPEQCAEQWVSNNWDVVQQWIPEGATVEAPQGAAAVEPGEPAEPGQE
ncbi:MAG: glycine betaine ABC transporter substrate-binding protein [Phycisphaeraceae bacterium]